MSLPDVNENPSFRETLKLLGFGFNTAHKLIPVFFPCMLVNSFITAAQPLLVLFFSARILNELSGSRDLSNIILFVSLTVGLTFILSVIKAMLAREIDTRAGREQAMRRIHMMQAERFAAMDFAHTDNSAINEMLSRMDVVTRSTSRGLLYLYLIPAEAADSLFSLIFASLLLTGAFSAGIIVLSPLAVGAFILLFVIGLIIGFHLQTKEKDYLQGIVAYSAEINTLADYYSSYYIKSDKAAKDLRIYNQTAVIKDIYSRGYASKKWISFMNFMGKINGFQLGLLAAIGGGFYLLVGYNALNNDVAIGSIVQTVGAVSAMAAAIGMLISRLGMIYNNAPFLQPLSNYLSLPDILHTGENDVPKPDGYDHEIEFRNVSFRYPGVEVYALKNLNLKFIPGERLAVVGLNGSGKTTMVKLLCRLYDPTEGEILLDGINIKEFKLEQYAKIFSVVFQDFALFPLWLGQNVAVEDIYDDDRVNKCLDNAGFAERLENMPEGLNTFLYKEYDESGTQVSGGEAQKIALARALYKNAPVVILDEPTAALDPIAEYEVYTTFDKTIGSKTAVFISHRLSSCRFCQRVAVFERGELIQLGSHDDLLADSTGRYHELWEAQAGHYREG